MLEAPLCKMDELSAALVEAEVGHPKPARPPPLKLTSTPEGLCSSQLEKYCTIIQLPFFKMNY